MAEGFNCCQRAYRRKSGYVKERASEVVGVEVKPREVAEHAPLVGKRPYNKSHSKVIDRGKAR